MYFSFHLLEGEMEGGENSMYRKIIISLTVSIEYQENLYAMANITNETIPHQPLMKKRKPSWNK